MAALLRRLHTDGLIHKSPLSPNARAFVKYKRLAKRALILQSCLLFQSKAVPAALALGPRGTAAFGARGGHVGAIIDLRHCYWSVHVPPAMAGAACVAAAGTTYAPARVPFDWH